jgi:hypothetical protein
MHPSDVTPGASATLRYIYMGGPATCSVAISYPGGGSTGLPAQTATYGGPELNYTMSWTFTVPPGTPAGPATATGTCTYPGYPFDPVVLGFSIVP